LLFSDSENNFDEEIVTLSSSGIWILTLFQQQLPVVFFARRKLYRVQNYVEPTVRSLIIMETAAKIEILRKWNVNFRSSKMERKKWSDF